MSIKTQGTHLFYVRPGSTPTVVKLHCPTGISGLGGAADQIDDTCLDEIDERSFVRGLGNPGQVSVPVNFDPTQASHEDLFALKESGEKIQWLIGLSDGTVAPSLDSDDAFVAPTARSSIIFTAYVSDFALDIGANDVVKGTLTLQRSGSVVFTPKA
jgi:hypothetical protein